MTNRLAGLLEQTDKPKNRLAGLLRPVQPAQVQPDQQPAAQPIAQPIAQPTPIQQPIQSQSSLLMPMESYMPQNPGEPDDPFAVTVRDPNFVPKQNELMKDIGTVAEAVRLLATDDKNVPEQYRIKDGEVMDRLRNIRTRAMSPLAMLMPGVSMKGLNEELDAQAEQFGGFGPALAPAAGEIGKLTGELATFQKMFGVVHKGTTVLGKLPASEKVAQAIKSMGGYEKFASKFPRIAKATADAGRAFAEGGTVGAAYGAMEGIDDEDMGVLDTLKNMGKKGATIGTVSAVFNLAQSADRARYVSKLRKLMTKRLDQQLKTEISKIPVGQEYRSVGRVKSLESVRDNGLRHIDRVVSDVEADLMSMTKGKVFGGQKAENPHKAAERFMRTGYTGEAYGKGVKSLQKGLGQRPPGDPIKLPTTRAGEIREDISGAIKAIKSPVKTIREAQARLPRKALAPARPIMSATATPATASNAVDKALNVAEKLANQTGQSIYVQNGKILRSKPDGEFTEVRPDATERGSSGVVDVTPEGFGPESGQGTPRNPMDLPWSDEQKKIMSSINESKTMLQGKLDDKKRNQIEKYIAKKQDELRSGLTQQQKDVIETARLEDENYRFKPLEKPSGDLRKSTQATATKGVTQPDTHGSDLRKSTQADLPRAETVPESGKPASDVENIPAGEKQGINRGQETEKAEQGPTSKAQQGKIDAHLNKPIKVDGETTKTRDWIESLAKNNYQFKKKEIANTKTGKKTAKYVAENEDGDLFELSKIQHDYGKSLAVIEDLVDFLDGIVVKEEKPKVEIKRDLLDQPVHPSEVAVPAKTPKQGELFGSSSIGDPAIGAPKPRPGQRDAGFAAIPSMPEDVATKKQKAMVHILRKEKGLSDADYKKIAVQETGKKSMSDMTKIEASRFIHAIERADTLHSPSFEKFHDYFQNLQLPASSKIPVIKKNIQRLQGKRLSGQITLQQANRQVAVLRRKLIEQGEKEGIAVRMTKGGKISLSLRQSDIFVSTDFANYPNFKDVVQGIKDPTRMIQAIDGSLSVKQKKTLPEQAGPAERNILWVTRDIALNKIDWIDEQAEYLKDVFGNIKPGSKADRQITHVLKHITTKDSMEMDAEQISRMPKIKKLNVEQDVIDKAVRLRKWYNEAIAAQNTARAMRNQPLIEYRKSYSPEILMNATVWEKMKALAEKAVTDKPGLPDYIHPNKPFNAREMSRKGGIPYDRQIKSAVELAQRYTSTAAKDIFNTAIIQNNKAYIQQLETMGLSKSAEAITGWTDEAYAGVTSALDRVIEKYAGAGERTRKAARKFNHARNLAVFPLNVAWTLTVQPSSIALTVGRYGITNTLDGLIKYMNPRHSNKWLNELYAYQIKTHKEGKLSAQDAYRLMGDNLTLKRTSLETVSDMANFFSNKVEALVSGASAEAALKHGRKRGLKGKALMEYASDAAAKTQSMYNTEDRPAMLRSLGVQTAMPFQTFTFEVLNTLGEFSGAKGTPPSSNKERLAWILRFLAATTVINMITEKTTGRKVWSLENPPLPFSELWYKPVYRRLTGQYLPSSSGLPSPIQVIDRVAHGITDVIDHGNWRRLRRELMTYGPGFFGIPGGVQHSRTVDAMIAYSEGQTTDVRGRKRMDVDDFETFMQLILTGEWQLQQKRQSQEKIKAAPSRRSAPPRKRASGRRPSPAKRR